MRLLPGLWCGGDGWRFKLAIGSWIEAHLPNKRAIQKSGCFKFSIVVRGHQEASFGNVARLLASIAFNRKGRQLRGC